MQQSNRPLLGAAALIVATALMIAIATIGSVSSLWIVGSQGISVGVAQGGVAPAPHRSIERPLAKSSGAGLHTNVPALEGARKPTYETSYLGSPGSVVARWAYVFLIPVAIIMVKLLWGARKANDDVLGLLVVERAAPQKYAIAAMAESTAEEAEEEDDDEEDEEVELLDDEEAQFREEVGLGGDNEPHLPLDLDEDFDDAREDAQTKLEEEGEEELDMSPEAIEARMLEEHEALERFAKYGLGTRDPSWDDPEVPHLLDMWVPDEEDSVAQRPRMAMRTLTPPNLIQHGEDTGLYARTLLQITPDVFWRGITVVEMWKAKSPEKWLDYIQSCLVQRRFFRNVVPAEKRRAIANLQFDPETPNGQKWLKEAADDIYEAMTTRPKDFTPAELSSLYYWCLLQADQEDEDLGGWEPSSEAQAEAEGVHF